jgi:alginate O-acetyltransferase complex protein AlgI
LALLVHSLAVELTLMLFVSFGFVLFFLTVFIGLWLLPSRDLRIWLLLAASAFFYATWKPAYLLILSGVVLVAYFCAIRIEASGQRRARRGWMAVGVIFSVGLLGYFKYANFFVQNVGALAGVAPRPLQIVLPLGISFFTFKAISYLVDVFRGEQPASRNPANFALYLSYFPDVLAGPIVRGSVFLPQLMRALQPAWPRTVTGSQMILLGLTKKLLIADQMAVFADPVFAEPGVYSPLTVWSAVIAYTLQIYCDFSGYSDMAIGMSKIIGIDLPENFNMPYLATSPIEFWQRWHITLTRWLRDYLYFALPGLRRSRWNRYRNAAITALLGGLWHGASWTFVAWGAMHGLAVGANHWWIARRQRSGRSPGESFLVRGICWAGTFLFLCVTWVLFRSATFASAGVMLRKMAGLAPGGIPWFYSPLAMVLPIVIGGHWIGVVASQRATSGNRTGPLGLRVKPDAISGVYSLLPLPSFAGGFLAACWILALFLFGATGASPFIYFQF